MALDYSEEETKLYEQLMGIVGLTEPRKISQAKSFYFEKIKLLLKQGAPIYYPDHELEKQTKGNAFSHIVKCYSFSTTELLEILTIIHQRDKTLIKKAEEAYRKMRGHLLLYNALINHDGFEIANLLLDAGVPVDAPEVQGERTALFLLVRFLEFPEKIDLNGMERKRLKLKRIKFLLDHGADPDYTTCRDLSVRSMAKEYNNDELFELLENNDEKNKVLKEALSLEDECLSMKSVYVITPIEEFSLYQFFQGVYKKIFRHPEYQPINEMEVVDNYNKLNKLKIE